MSVAPALPPAPPDRAMGAPLLAQRGLASVGETAESADTRKRTTFHVTDVLMLSAKDILAKGLTKTLCAEDVEDVLESEEPCYTSSTLWAAWEYRKSLGRPSLFRCFADCWKHLFFLQASIHVFDAGLQFVAPQMIKVLINYVSAENKSISLGLLYAAIFFLAPSLQAIASCHFNLHGRRLGFRLRGATSAIIYEKILRLSQQSEASYGPGKLTNVMSTDAQRLELLPYYANFIWSMPLMLFVGTWLLYQNLQVAAFMPIVITGLMYPVNSALTKRMTSNRREISMKQDSRIKLLTEVLHALELVKQLTWEHHIKDLVDEKRSKELRQIAHQKLLDVFNNLIWNGIPALLPFFTIGSYALAGGVLDPGSVFASLALMDMVTFPMKMFPEAISNLVQAQVGIDRIECLLLAEEALELPYPHPKDESVSATPLYIRGMNMRGESVLQSRDVVHPVTMSSVHFRWAKPNADNDRETASLSNQRRCWWRRRDEREVSLPDEGTSENQEPPTLQVSSLQILSGKFVLVVGPVGAGKSTLLQGLLNEVPMLRGRVELCASVAYCPQKPWILNATVRENILFGNAYSPDAFAEVARVCALEADFKQLENGDATLIGTRGVNLSGGQKARVSLARAVYSRRSLYMLDDPLAAVDPHVATHLVEECFCGFLRGTTRILITHQLQFLDKADLVVVVRDGQIEAVQPPSAFSAEELAQLGSSLDATAGDEVATAPESDNGLPVPLSRAVSAPPPRLSRALSAPLQSRVQPRLRRAVSAPSEKDLDHAIELETESKMCNALNVSFAESTEPTGQIGQQEDRETGSVGAKYWATYARTMGFHAAIALMILYISSNVLQLLAMFWVGHWSASSASSISTIVSLMIYAVLSLGTVVLMSLRTLIFRRTSLRVSEELHDKALWAVMRTKKSWLDSTPTGRIVNRFSQDMTMVDSNLQGMVSIFADNFTSLIISFSLVLILAPVLLVAVAPLGYLYLKVQRTFRQSSRELRRLSSLAKSPIFQNLDETIAGAPTIRAFRQQDVFIKKNEGLQSRSVATDFMNSLIGRWMEMRMRFLGMTFVAIVACYIVLQEHLGFLQRLGLTLSTPMIGLALRYALSISDSLQSMIQSLTITERGLIALERLTAFCDLEAEYDLVLASEAGHADSPATGEIVFKDVVMRYREDMPTVLKGISFIIPGGTSVGVVGRTGSGKSTLLVALFRLRELEAGSISIDGTDTSAMGLHTLRRKLAIIPQEAVGFTGSLRFNLDPFGAKSDAELWAELEKVQMKSFAEAHGLDYHLTEGGENLSAGERQLMCAARAFLQNARILVLDEATASVDFQTDALIQEVLKAEVRTKSLTTITIAHRINTILESDNVLVLDKGQVAEFGPTSGLSNDPASVFYTFVHPSARSA